MSYRKTLVSVIILLVLSMLLSACGIGFSGEPEGKPYSRFTGMWYRADGEEENKEFGSAIIFYPDGTLCCVFESDLTKDGTVSTDIESVKAAAESIKDLYKIFYSVANENTVALTYSTMNGFIQKPSYTTFLFDGDSLIFDNTKYTKISD